MLTISSQRSDSIIKCPSHANELKGHCRSNNTRLSNYSLGFNCQPASLNYLRRLLARLALLIYKFSLTITNSSFQLPPSILRSTKFSQHLPVQQTIFDIKIVNPRHSFHRRSLRRIQDAVHSFVFVCPSGTPSLDHHRLYQWLLANGMQSQIWTCENWSASI